MRDGGAFRCTFQPLDGVVCLVLSGDLDLAGAATFRAHLALAARDSDGLVLDLRDLRYLDSSGINALLDTYRASGTFGRRIALAGPSPSVRRILSVLQLEHQLEHPMPAFDTLGDALAYVREGRLPLAGDG